MAHVPQEQRPPLAAAASERRWAASVVEGSQGQVHVVSVLRDGVGEFLSEHVYDGADDFRESP